jgi:rhodanese-related sulfurtransferase
MKNTIVLSAFFLSLLLISSLLLLGAGAAQNDVEISGEVRKGYRVLHIPEGKKDINFAVFRGDYLKFSLGPGLETLQLRVPSLKINKALTNNLSGAPYFKMKKTGDFPFTIGGTGGRITVVEFDRPQYQAVTSEEAAQLIKNISPLVLDVRTSQEYAGGHLDGSVHIPVQEIQKRYKELSNYKNENILIYCATGNRSTVASKILIDNGFNRIFNLREGVHVWAGKGYPVVR